MSDPQDILVNSMINRSYYNLPPDQLSSLHSLSNTYLATNQFALADDLRLNLLEQHFYLSLLTCHDSEAKLVLQRLTDKFTDDPSRVAILKSQYIEVTEGPEAAQKYLESRPSNDILSFKRSISLLKQKKDLKPYVQELLKYVEQVAPNDSEVLAELAEAYISLGNYQQAIHCLEEVIINVPLAYNVFSRLGEVYFIDANNTTNANNQLTLLTQSSKNFLRSIELSPDYIRAWCGVLTTSSKIVSLPKLPQEESTKQSKLITIAKSQVQRILESSKELAISDQDIAAAQLIIDKYN